MTGFGHSHIVEKDFELDIQVKSVNGRFLDLRLHIPREYHPFDSEIKKTLSQFFARGTVDLYCNRRVQLSEKNAKLVINEEIAKSYVQAFNKLSKKLKLKDELSINILARLPEISQLKTQDEVSDQEKKVLLKTLEQACKSCLDERLREAKALKRDLLDNLKNLENLIQKIQEIREEVNSELAEKFASRLKALGLTEQIDPIRILQEVSVQIDRSDINEELSRLGEHISSYRKLIQSGDQHGKKLDFYAQELLREINTIGSKSQVAKLTSLVVDAKSVIERIREQVQNVE